MATHAERETQVLIDVRVQVEDALRAAGVVVADAGMVWDGSAADIAIEDAAGAGFDIRIVRRETA